MISLTSGLPGAGKTLWTIAFVEALRKKENRDVYYHGIKGLTLPWVELEDPKKWFDCPAGAIIVIDEAQHHFPLRGPSQTKPPHVERTATHRHHGHDIFLITQHPSKIDAAVRKDIEVHRHLMRKFGSKFATVHQWQGVRETCDKTRKDSVSTTWRYPKEVFGWYKSAEVHTHKLSVPPKMIFAVVFLLVVAFAWYLWISRMSEKALGGAPADEVTTRVPGVMAGGALPGVAGAGQRRDAPKTVAEYVAERVPRVAGLEHTAPVYDGLTAPNTVPLPAACIQWAGKGCKCFTQQGTPYRTSEDICLQIVRTGIFIDFAGPTASPANSRETASPSPSGARGPVPPLSTVGSSGLAAPAGV